MYFNLEDYMLPCLNKKLFGFDCLGCGLQRSFLLLLKGDFYGAFKMYPGIFSLIFLMGYVLLNMIYNFKNSIFMIRLLFAINGVLIVGNFILKLF